MKRFFLMFVLLIAMSISIFAGEGEMGPGGKTCPRDQTCLTDGDMGNGGKTSCPPGQSCLDGDMPTGSFIETLYQTVFANIKITFR